MFLGCLDSSTYRQGLEWITYDHTGQLAVFRWVTGDTGWLKGQGHMRAHVWLANQSPVSFWTHAPPEFVQWSESEIQIGVGQSQRKKDSLWQLDSHFDEWNVRVQTPCSESPVNWQVNDDWSGSVQCIEEGSIGWVQSHTQSFPIQGWTVTIQHSGTQPPQDRISIFGVSAGVQLAIEVEHSEIFGLFNIDGTSIPVQSINQTESGWSIETDSSAIPIENIEFLGMDDPYEHIPSWERALVGTRFPSPPIKWYRGRMKLNDRSILVILRHQTDD